MAYHHELLINPPKEVYVTKEQFDKMSYMGIATFFCNFPGAILEREDNYEVYMQEWRAQHYFNLKEKNQKRFEGLSFVKYESAEMGMITVPKDHILANTLNKYFKHLFLK